MSSERVPSNTETMTEGCAVAAIGGGWLLAPDPTREEQLRASWAMSVPQRVSAMRAGGLSRHQLFAWVARYPEQCPVVDGEWEFIAATMADLDPD